MANESPTLASAGVASRDNISTSAQRPRQAGQRGRHAMSCAFCILIRPTSLLGPYWGRIQTNGPEDGQVARGDNAQSRIRRTYFSFLLGDMMSSSPNAPDAAASSHVSRVYTIQALSLSSCCSNPPPSIGRRHSI